MVKGSSGDPEMRTPHRGLMGPIGSLRVGEFSRGGGCYPRHDMRISSHNPSARALAEPMSLMLDFDEKLWVARILRLKA